MIHAIMTESDLQTLERRIMLVDTALPPDCTADSLDTRFDAERAWYRDSFANMQNLIATVREMREDVDIRDRHITHLQTVSTEQVERIRSLQEEVAELKEWRDDIVPTLIGAKPDHLGTPLASHSFEQDLRAVLNRHSRECAGGDTPDFILADYLAHCLDAFGEAVRRRNAWYGPNPTFDPTPATHILNDRTGTRHDQGGAS